MDCFTAARDVTQRTLSFDIHAIFTLVSAARVRNIAISINVLNFFFASASRSLVDFCHWILTEDSHSSPSSHSSHTLHQYDRLTIGTRPYEATQASSLPRRFCFLLVHVFFPLFITPILFDTPYSLFLPINVIEIFSGNFQVHYSECNFSTKNFETFSRIRLYFNISYRVKLCPLCFTSLYYIFYIRIKRLTVQTLLKYFLSMIYVVSDAS